MKLSRENLARAQAFVRAQARPLDRQLLAYYFEEAPAESVLAALAPFQNEDGGFGHGIEPDFRTHASSPIATSVGLQYCVAVGAGADQPLVRAAMGYLHRTFEAGEGYWPAVYPNVADSPHAPWWFRSRVAPPPEADWANPSAELAGYAAAYRELLPANFVQQVLERTEECLAVSATTGDLPHRIYQALCWERAAAHLDDPLKAAALEKVRQVYREGEPLTAAKLREQRIAWLAPSSHSVLAQLVPDVVDQLLDEEIVQQAADGGWWPGWQWGQYEDVWRVARREWAGKITVEILHALSLHGKVQA